jgi:hypothetical protein
MGPRHGGREISGHREAAALVPALERHRQLRQHVGRQHEVDRRVAPERGERILSREGWTPKPRRHSGEIGQNPHHARIAGAAPRRPEMDGVDQDYPFEAPEERVEWHVAQQPGAEH